MFIGMRAGLWRGAASMIGPSRRRVGLGRGRIRNLSSSVVWLGVGPCLVEVEMFLIGGHGV